MLAAAHKRRTGETPSKGQGQSSSTASSPALAEELKQVIKILEDQKAQNLTVIPLMGQASFADYLVIVTGTSTRHVSSMGHALRDKLGKRILGLEGLTDGEWVCADMGSVVVHIFVPEKRALYNLEKLWSHVFTDAEPQS